MQEVEVPQSDYGNSRPFDVHRWSEYPEVKAAVTQVAEEIAKAKGKGLTRKQKTHLRVVILDLYANYLTDPEKFIGYSRDRSKYSAPSRYNKLHIKYDPLMPVIDGLFELGYVEGKKGYSDRRTGIGRQARMRATEKLVDLIQNRHKVTPEMIERAEDEETIILRDSAGKYLDYAETTETERMRENLTEYNLFLAKTSISLALRQEDMPRIDLTRKRLHRVFNNSSFEQGGRFFGGWWQEMPKGLRKQILINGKPTIEVDYSGLHIKLLYLKEGIDYRDDPYQFAGQDLRGLLKLSILIALNADDRKSALLAIRAEARKDQELAASLNLVEKERDGLAKLLDEFLAHHLPISQYLFTGIGISLQNLDSKIAEKVLMTLTRDGIVVLPVHDSFITISAHREKLVRAMNIAFQYFTKGYMPQMKEKEPMLDGFIDIYMDKNGKADYLYRLG